MLVSLYVCTAGICYQFGTGVLKDEEEAVRLYTLAAGQGDPDAQCILARCLRDGTGVAHSLVEAGRYFQLAATQGHAQAVKELAKLQ
jgi:TPR repeat protein